MSAPPSACAECGRPLAPDAPHPLCPGCLLAGALTPLPAEPGGPDQPAAVLRLGGYELLELLGRGGMGQVWRASQLGAQREVALKVIASGLLATDAERRRFQAEVESAARLDHPNIVPVYEVGEAEGRPYFTMKLVPGGTLADRLRADSPFSISHSAFCIPLLSAVARDVLGVWIRPQALLLGGRGDRPAGDAVKVEADVNAVLPVLRGGLVNLRQRGLVEPLPVAARDVRAVVHGQADEVEAVRGEELEIGLAERAVASGEHELVEQVEAAPRREVRPRRGGQRLGGAGREEGERERQQKTAERHRGHSIHPRRFGQREARAACCPAVQSFSGRGRIRPATSSTARSVLWLRW